MQNNSFSVQLSESIFVLRYLTFWCQNGTDINHCKTVFGFQHQRKANATVGLFIIHLYSYKIVDQSLFERNSLPHNTEQTTLPIFKYLYEHSVFYHSNFCVVLLFRNILRFYGTLFCFRVNINVIFNNIPFL